jgi:predicted solute-binding protein
MHVVIATLGSLGASVYAVFGLAFVFGSMAVRRLAIEPTSKVADASSRDGVKVRIRSKKVVPINRNTRLSRRPVFQVRRVGNYF